VSYSRSYHFFLVGSTDANHLMSSMHALQFALQKRSTHSAAMPVPRACQLGFGFLCERFVAVSVLDFSTPSVSI
jgi:hypothetical protein